MTGVAPRRLGLVAILFGLLALLSPAVSPADPGSAEKFVLDLGGERFDPLEASPGRDLPEAWKRLNSASDPGSADLRLVQLVGPIDEAWPRILRAAGLEIVQYVHPYTYIVWGRGDDLDRLVAADEARKSGAFVRWTGDFSPAFRVLPRWRELAAERAASKAGDLVRARVLVYRGAGPARVAERLETLGVRVLGRRAVDRVLSVLRVDVPAARFAEVAAVPGVYSLQVEPTDGGLRAEYSAQIVAGQLDEDNRAEPGYPAWLSTLGLSGAGVVVAVVDNGVDENHPDLVSRLIACAGETCGGEAREQHGTHVAGIVGGDAASAVTDADGFLRGQGVAPGASLFEQLYSPFFVDAGGMLQLMSESRANGADLSSNSWGPAGSPRGYDVDTRQVDVGVRDADASTPGSQPLTYVLAIMNGYGNTSSQGTPDEAKNLVAVGSTWAQNGGGPGDLSNNSAHGPALDGRLLPHLVAPGCRVDSTLPGASYGFFCGTSMAAPHVAGAAALFVEKYRADRYSSPNAGEDPSPALVKAALLATTVDLAGGLDADGAPMGHPFDDRQGWGRLDLEALLDPPVPHLLLDASALLDATGERWSIEAEPADPSRPLRVMLAWTDAPGHGLGGTTPAWNNDLDLVVTVTDSAAVEETPVVYLGNAFGPDGTSTANAATPDASHNTEGVRLAPTQLADRLLVEVVAANLPSDGVPETGDETDQDFALVCVNCRSLEIFADGFESGDTSRWSSP